MCLPWTNNCGRKNRIHSWVRLNHLLNKITWNEKGATLQWKKQWENSTCVLPCHRLYPTVIIPKEILKLRISRKRKYVLSSGIQLWGSIVLSPNTHVKSISINIKIFLKYGSRCKTYIQARLLIATMFQRLSKYSSAYEHVLTLFPPAVWINLPHCFDHIPFC